MGLPDKLIEDVKYRLKRDPLPHYASRMVLKQKGTSYVGLCPFHKEQTPSLVVTPGKDLFKCFGCGKGGDTIKFIMLKDGISFIEAVKLLGNYYSLSNY